MFSSRTTSSVCGQLGRVAFGRDGYSTLLMLKYKTRSLNSVLIILPRFAYRTRGTVLESLSSNAVQLVNAVTLRNRVELADQLVELGGRCVQREESIRGGGTSVGSTSVFTSSVGNGLITHLPKYRQQRSTAVGDVAVAGVLL